MTTVTLIAVVGVLFSVAIGVTVFYGERGDRYRKEFVILSALICAWVIGNLVFSITSGTTQYLVALGCYMAAMLLAVQLFIFAQQFVNNNSHQRNEKKYIIPGLVAALLSPIPGVIAYDVIDSKIQTNIIPLILYSVILSTYLIASCIALTKVGRNTTHQKRQIANIILVGIFISALFGVFCNLVLPILGVYDFTQLGPAGSIVFVGAVAYTIVRHGLFGIKLTLVRTVAYVLSIATLAIVYFVLAYIGSTFILQNMAMSDASVRPIDILPALALAIIFQPIKHGFDRITDKVFFHNRYNTDIFIEHLGKILTTTTQLRVLLESTSREIQDALKASHVSFVVFHAEKQTISYGSGKCPKFTDEEYIVIKKHLSDWDRATRVVDRLTGIEGHRQTSTVMDILRRKHVAIITPLGVGLLLIGESKGIGYDKRDIRMLNTISNELTIAIQNARSVQEIRELNLHLQQKIDQATRELRDTNSELRKLDATKDEFINMASHQLRTPLTSIKGYLSMALEGDVGEINAQQRKILGEAFSSSERMVRLISDFLNVSRLQTGKFVIDAQPADLAHIVAEEVEAMRPLAESHEIMLTYKRPKKPPLLNLDIDKLRQVVMNFIDNSIYYSRPKSTIAIKLYVEHDEAILEIHDHGIGVPKDQQKQLFTKFFRAENARRQRPDGTGVGLFLARKVVTAHGGQIIFSSHEGKGSMFGFRLPIKKLRSK